MSEPINPSTSMVTNHLRFKSTGDRLNAMADQCKCGAVLDSRGRCPALCESLQPPLPQYDGPAIIGLTHIGRLGREGA